MNETSRYYSTTDQRGVIQGELEPGESIVWFEQPLPRLFTIQTIPLVIFAIPWTAFAVFWMAMAAGFGSHTPPTRGLGLVFPLFGLPFVLIGAGMLLSPFWALRTSRRTYYAITDRRAIIFTGGRGATIQSFAPDHLQAITRRQRSDGSGDILFNTTYGQVVRAGSVQLNGFFSIRNVREVERLLMDLAQKADAPLMVRRAS